MRRRRASDLRSLLLRGHGAVVEEADEFGEVDEECARVNAGSGSHNLDAPYLARQRCRGKSSSTSTYVAGAPFRFAGERRLHKEQIVATHTRKHAKILPSFGPHGCVKPYCCLSGLIRVLALVRKKLQ